MLRSLIVGFLCFSLTFLNPSASVAGLITLQEISQRNQKTFVQQAMSQLDNPEARTRLAAFGLSPEQAKERLAGLSDQELREMVESSTGQKAGGDVIVISLTTVLLIVIIVLLLR